MALAAELQLVIAGCAALLIGALIRPLLGRLRLPYSVALLLIGLLAGLASRLPQGGGALAPLGQLVAYLSHLEPHLLLALFLPILIFQSALSFESHLFRQLLPPMLLLAIPGIVIATLITALLCWWWLPYGWGWREALLFGALISATDPVAVVALLRELGARAGLETVIEGESLLNDGTAIVLFVLVLNLFGAGVNWPQVPLQFLWVVAGGAVLGWFLALLLKKAMPLLAAEPPAQVGLTLAAAYGSYLLAESLGLSGVVALVALGVSLGRHLRLVLAPAGREFLRQLWEFLAHSANTLIFLIVGLIIGARTPLSGSTPWAALLIVFVIIHLARGLMLLSLWPWLKRQMQWLDWRNGLLLWWGGLRGAVALVLALSLLHQQLPLAVAEAVLFLTAGIVLLTLLINAPLTPCLLAKLGLDQPSPERLAVLANRRARLHLQLQQSLPASSSELSLPHADMAALAQLFAGCWYERELVAEAPAALLLERERSLYLQLYDAGVLSAATLELLLARLDEARDTADLDRRHLLRRQAPVNGHWRWLGGLRRRYLQRYHHPHLAAAYGEQLALARVQRQLLAEASPALQPALLSNVQMLERHLQQWRQQFPELVACSETYLAGRVLLTRQLRRIDRWQQQELLTASEADSLRQVALPRLQRLELLLRQTRFSLRDELNHWPAFAALAGSELELLLVAGERLWRDEGELLGRQGQPCNQLWLLLRGDVQLIRQQHGVIDEVRLLGSGCRLGGEALADDEWGATVKAVSDLLLLALPLATVVRWQRQQPRLWAAVNDLPH